MSTIRTIPVNPNVQLTSVLQMASQTLMNQGYSVQIQTMSPTVGIMTVTKNRDGFLNIIGLGNECTANVSIANNMMNISIDSEWLNIILAMALGWFFCLIPFITGIVGAINQSGLPDKIFNALTMSNNAGMGQNNMYQ